jgi:hypothetical protein
MSMNFSTSKQFVKPPQRGIFPLDHDAECKPYMEVRNGVLPCGDEWITALNWMEFHCGRAIAVPVKSVLFCSHSHTNTHIVDCWLCFLVSLAVPFTQLYSWRQRRHRLLPSLSGRASLAYHRGTCHVWRTRTILITSAKTCHVITYNVGWTINSWRRKTSIMYVLRKKDEGGV